MTYKQRFRQACAADGLDLGVADALRRLRAGASVEGGGWKRLLDRCAKWNARRRQVQQEQEKKGRAA